jgi:hypothetical protein
MKATRQMKLKKGYTPTQEKDDYPDRDWDNGLAKLTLWVILPIVFLQLILK